MQWCVGRGLLCWASLGVHTFIHKYICKLKMRFCAQPGKTVEQLYKCANTNKEFIEHNLQSVQER